MSGQEVPARSVTREEIRERDAGHCARCGAADSLHVHHRWLRSQGGPDSWENQVTLCAGCHDWAHNHPGEALEQGWLVASWDDPAGIPVRHWLWPAGPVSLLPDGMFGIDGWGEGA